MFGAKKALDIIEKVGTEGERQKGQILYKNIINLPGIPPET